MMDCTFFWLGLLFGLIGALFTALGVALAPAVVPQSPVFLVFPVLGLVFLGLGIALLGWRRWHRRRCAHLRETGQLVWTEFVELRQDRRFAINGRHPYVLICEAEDPRTDELCLFASDSIWEDPSPYLRVGFSVPVYVDPDHWDNYVMDVAAVLPMLEK